jgi:hypothetical protein
MHLEEITCFAFAFAGVRDIAIAFRAAKLRVSDLPSTRIAKLRSTTTILTLKERSNRLGKLGLR